MAYLTFDRLKKQQLKFSEGGVLERAFSLNESLGSVSATDKRVFLSYRRRDVAYVKPIVKLLKSLGIAIYIDYLDDKLPNPPDYTTAAVLRSSLIKCQKFILLATPNSKDSNWMPWELGLGDGHTGYENTIIFPLLDNEIYWTEREFYKIYGYIKEGERKDKSKKDWAVFYPDREPIWLSGWLNT